MLSNYVSLSEASKADELLISLLYFPSFLSFFFYQVWIFSMLIYEKNDIEGFTYYMDLMENVSSK